jgi:type IV pilus assembly protein PilY1
MYSRAQLMKTASLLYGALLVLVSAPASAVINISNTPLFLAVTVPPNLVLTLDDSGSMRRAFVPENCLADTSDCTHLDNRYEKASNRNLIHYDPTVKYPQPRNAAGAFLTTSFTAAWRNGFDQAAGTAVNLSNNYRPTAMLDLAGGVTTEDFMGHFSTDSRCSTSSGAGVCQISNGASGWVSGVTACVGSTSTARNTFCRGADPLIPGGVPAYYYVFDAANASCNGTDTDNDCYDIKIVSSTSGPAVRDLNGDGVVSALDRDERQNFANWFSFARTRNLATQTAASISFNTLDSSVRVGWQALNSCRSSTTALVDTDCDGWKSNFTAVSNAIRPFSGTHRANFFNWAQQQPTAGGTPLPEAMARVGEYYRTSGENGPYDNNFSTSSSGEHACRRNYHILMTDGIWTDASTVGNTDNSTITLPAIATEPNPDITQYAPRAPYRDSTSNTLADVAFRYWITDLRQGATALQNNISPLYRDRLGDATAQYWNPRNDPATWQHMVNYTIGLGLTDFLAGAGLTWTGDMYSGSYTDLANGMTAWPVANATTNNPGNVADLWHAAINSRGQFFSADNPSALSTAFAQVLTAISGDAGSSAALSTNSTSIQPGQTVVYQAKFNRDWSGTLLSLPVDINGSVGSQIWDASQLIPAHGSRRIFTHNGSLGVEFLNCSNLSITQQLALNTHANGTVDLMCADRIAWLRGDPSREQRNNGPFRNRVGTVMGDVINSDPAYVKDLNYGYTGLPAGTPGQSTYNDYVIANGSRDAMVYVGSNDGRVYGIDAQTGVERFSYVPSGVFHQLTHLTDPLYTHRFYVDGGITVGDAFIGSEWRTMLVAGLNSGGNSIYALDVTDAGAFDAGDVKWEFTDTDLGMTFSQPQIGILESGQWVAVFGNGYNSANGGSYLYVVDLQTGALLKKILAVDAAGDDNNGLSTPLLYDADDDNLIDTVYAGDLQGNLWKFDVSATTTGPWGVAFAGSPLIRARNASNQVQAITAQPKATGHPLGGHMVVFGTGRYLTPGDPLDLTVQSYYGIRDNGSPVVSTNRSALQQQTIDLQTTAFGTVVRSITEHTPDWATEQGWYLDFIDPPSTLLGERVVSTSLIKGDRVIFVSIVPSTDPCRPGGTSWLMELNVVTGGTFADSILDMNGDGAFDGNDTAGGQVVTGVRMDSLGISKTPAWLGGASVDADGNPVESGVAYKVMTGTTGAFGSAANKCTENCGGPTPPPGSTPVQRRSWIQIR